MQIDINKLVKSFRQVENENSNPITVCDYLKNEVLKPLLSGATLYISDIDFSGFSMDELKDFRLFLIKASGISDKLHQICGTISNIKPRAVTAPAFC